MGRFITYVLVFIGIIGIGVLNRSPDTKAQSQPDKVWIESEIVKRSELPTVSTPEDTKTCAGTPRLIEVRGGKGYTDACVFGDSSSLRLARYRGLTNDFLYSVAFPSDVTFVPVVGLCTGMAQCAYGKTGDTLIMQTPAVSAESNPIFTYMMVKNFTKYLIREPDSASSYQFKYPSEFSHLKVGSAYVGASSVKVSANGRWAVFELTKFGFIRLDLKTLEYKRIVSYDALLPHPTLFLETAVSDDGRWIAITGLPSFILLFEADDICGDRLDESSNQYYRTGTISCNAAVIMPGILYPAGSAVHAPKFSLDGRKLHFDVRTGVKTVTTTLSPRSYGLHEPFYAAFGDSFTSGEGETDDTFYIPSTNTSENRCHVSTRSYPYLLGEAWELVTTNFACSGSRTDEVREANRKYATRTDRSDPTVISLGVGGNDVDFMGKLKTCIGVGTCEWAKQKQRKATAYEIQSLLPLITNLIVELKATYANKHLFVVGYPNIINDHPSAKCSPVVSLLLDAEERRYMKESISYINSVLREAADYSRVTFVDIEDAYEGERLCDSTESAMNSVRYGSDIAPIAGLGTMKVIGSESFHPTPRGHQLAANVALNEGLRNFWASPTCTTCQFDASELALSAYWQEGSEFDEPVFRQFATLFLESETVVHKLSALYSFTPGTFEPGSSVRFELHSEVKMLGQVTAADDGSLRGNLVFPEGMTGYHTVHAYGKSYSGESINIYQTVYIDTTNIPISLDGVSGTGITATTVTNAASEGVIKDENMSVADEAVLVREDVLGYSQQESGRTAAPARVSGKGDPFFYSWCIALGLVLFAVGGMFWALLAKRNQEIPPRQKHR